MFGLGGKKPYSVYYPSRRAKWQAHWRSVVRPLQRLRYRLHRWQGRKTKLTHATEREGTIYVESYSQMLGGPWVTNGVAFAVPKGDPAMLGLVVRQCLDASLTGIPNVTSWPRNVVTPAMKLAGAKSYSFFVRGTLSMSVMTKDGVTGLFKPMLNGGSKGPNRGYRPLLKKAFTLQLGSDEELGASVIAALALSELSST